MLKDNVGLVCSSVCALLVACGGSGEAPPLQAGEGTDRVRFIATGDTGTGCDDGAQCAVAQVMELVCAAKGCDFVLIAGDNIYEDGVDGVDDEQFRTKFEEPYANLDVPFYMALGNHDVTFLVGGDAGNQTRGDFQVEYHWRSENQKWRMPFRYYTKRFPPNADTPLVELFALDSAALVRFIEDSDPNWSGAGFDAYLMDQRRFMNDAISRSNARWKIAAAHHPYISNGGEHGNAGSYQQESTPDLCVGDFFADMTSLDDVDEGLTLPTPGELLPVLASDSCRGEQYKAFLEDTVCDRVDVFFAGHDHDLQWLQPVASCGRTHHIVSGAGAKSRGITPERNEAFFQIGESVGFIWVEIAGDTMTGEFYLAQADGTPPEIDAQGNPAPVFTKSITRQR